LTHRACGTHRIAEHAVCCYRVQSVSQEFRQVDVADEAPRDPILADVLRERVKHLCCFGHIGVRRGFVVSPELAKRSLHRSDETQKVVVDHDTWPLSSTLPLRERGKVSSMTGEYNKPLKPVALERGQ